MSDPLSAAGTARVTVVIVNFNGGAHVVRCLECLATQTVPPERILLVEKRKWLNADQFMAYLAISQTMPGLNSVNLAVLTGDYLRGIKGSVIALLGLVLPGSVLVLLLGLVYTALTDHAITVLLLTGIAAGATGLLAAVTYRIGDEHWKKPISLLLIATTFVLMSIVKLPLLEVLAIMVPIGLFIYRPKGND
jgi:chromate transporter